MSRQRADAKPDTQAADACLFAAFDPVEEQGPTLMPPSRNIREAICRLDRQTDLLVDELKGRIPFHDTLRQIIQRMGWR